MIAESACAFLFISLRFAPGKPSAVTASLRGANWAIHALWLTMRAVLFLRFGSALGGAARQGFQFTHIYFTLDSLLFSILSAIP